MVHPQPFEYPYLPEADGSKTTLWMGDLEPWMDEQYLRQLWMSLGEDIIVKLIRDKRTGAGYAFVDFSSPLAAQRVLATVHGTKLPNSQRTFRLNWASGGGIHDRKEDRAPEYSLFVGDLGSEVDETLLLALFRQHYPSCHSAKVMTDPVSGLSRGYGFVRFRDPNEQQSALTDMNGVYCGSRPMRVSLATPKNSNARYHQLALQAPALVQQITDPTNTTVFIGGLSSPVTEDELRQYFAPFGDIVYVKIPPNKGCGFVQYVTRQSAETAIEQMNGFQIGSSRIRLSWGRSQNDKSAHSNVAAQSTAWQSQHAAHIHPGNFLRGGAGFLGDLSIGPTSVAGSSVDTFPPSFSPPHLRQYSQHQHQQQHSPPLLYDYPNLSQLQSPQQHLLLHPQQTLSQQQQQQQQCQQRRDPGSSSSSNDPSTWLLFQGGREHDSSWRLNGIYAQ